MKSEGLLSAFDVGAAVNHQMSAMTPPPFQLKAEGAPIQMAGGDKKNKERKKTGMDFLLGKMCQDIKGAQKKPYGLRKRKLGAYLDAEEDEDFHKVKKKRKIMGDI